MKMRLAMVGLVWVMASSCSTIRNAQGPLRVGVSPNYPPLIMMQAGKATGAETDMAALLSRDLGRPLVLISVPWDELFQELEKGTVDIVMSGITVTPARRVRMAFCESYLQNPLVAVARRSEAGGYASAGEVLGARVAIGVMGNTSAEGTVRRKCANAKIRVLSSGEDAAFNLVNRRIDLYIDDLAAAVDIVSRNEAQLEIVRFPLVPQELAWAVRIGDEELRQQANAALAKWRASGELEAILDRWMSYRRVLATDSAAPEGGR